MRHVRRIIIATLSFFVWSQPAVTKELDVVGTGDGLEMLQSLAAAFNHASSGGTASPSVRIPPSIGSGGGITAVGARNAEIARVARSLTEAEVARGLVYVPVARLPSAFFIHPDIGIRNLSRSQVADIYAGRISNWKDVGGADLRIRVVRREEADSTLITLRGQLPEWKGLEITERSKTAVSTQEAVETVRLVAGAIGFGPYSRALETGTQVVSIDGRYPTDRDYPVSNVLAFVHRSEPLGETASAFVTFTRSEAGANIMRSYGALPAAD